MSTSTATFTRRQMREHRRAIHRLFSELTAYAVVIVCAGAVAAAGPAGIVHPIVAIAGGIAAAVALAAMARRTV